MEISCKSFWQWGNARKKFSSAKNDSAGSGSCSMLNESSPVADGSCLKFTDGGGPWKARKCMDAAFIRRSLAIYEDNASKSGAPCRDMGLRVQCATVDVNLSNFKCNNGEANSSKSPISIIQNPKVSSSLNTNTSNYYTIAFCPHDGLSPELQLMPCCSDEILVLDEDFCEEEEPSELMAWKTDSFSAEGICCIESSKEASPSCSKSENMQLQSCCMNEELRNLRAVGVSEATSSYSDSCCKRLKTGHNLIFNCSSEIQKEKSESFAALHILADMAVWVLENDLPGYKGEGKGKDSTGQWAIFHPTGVPFRQKRAIRRSKSAFKSVSQLHGYANNLMTADSELLQTNRSVSQLHGYANNLMAADSELLQTNKCGSPESIETNENQIMDGGVGEKDHGAIQSVRSSKRTRSHFLNSVL